MTEAETTNATTGHVADLLRPGDNPANIHGEITQKVACGNRLINVSITQDDPTHPLFAST